MNHKRLISILLCAVLLITAMMPLAVSAKELTATVAGYNSSRGAGELVVYTADYGEKTGTNIWGAEVIVGEDNAVTSIGTGNTAIPADGFVLSGHDDDSTENGSMMKTWIRENITIGDYVYFDRRSMTVTVSDVPLDIEVSPFYAVSKEYTAINDTRNENTLIVYDVFRGETTGTNAYGYEVVVDNGAVVSRGGNDNAIPTNGFVVSGHGTMVTWLRNNVIDGMSVTLDKDAGVVTFTYDANSLKTAVDGALTRTEQAIADAKAAFVYADYDAAQTALDAVKTAVAAATATHDSGGADAAFADTCDQALIDLETVRNGLCDSYTVQYRCVWVRPSQRTASEVDDFVERLYNEGINTVCVEGWFENGVIMEVPEDSLFGKHPRFNYDVLQAYIDACHARKMECHLWMPVMNVGSSIDGGYERTVFSEHPEWASLNQEGSYENDDGFVMIDPANAEARAYLVAFYEYLVTTYDIDCFELDYIRYYAATDEYDFGYTEAAFAGFEEAYGYGVTPTYDPDAAYWADWCQYRRDCVTATVVAVREMMDRAAPQMLLSADVAVPTEHALDKVYQNFPQWLEEGYLDMLHPMAYGDGYGDEIRTAVELGGDGCIVVTGLGVMTDNLNAAEMERQAREDNRYGTYGDAYFEANTYLSDQAGAALKTTVYRNEALAPFFDPDASIVEALAYMQGRIDEVLLPFEGVTQAEADAITAAITAASAAVSEATMDDKALAVLQEAVDVVANEQARTVLQDDLYRAKRITLVLQDGEEVTSVDSALPVWVWIAVGGAAVIILAVIVLVVIKKRKA